MGITNYIADVAPDIDAVHQKVYDNAVEREEAIVEKLIGENRPEAAGDDNAYRIAKELGVEMTAASTVVKTGPKLRAALEKVDELKERFAKVRLADGVMWTNQNLSFSRSVSDMLLIAEAIAKGGELREESRGSHYRTDCLDRVDDRFMKTTVAAFNPETGKPDISYREVVTGLVKPRPRTYGKTDAPTEKKEAAATTS